MDRGKTGRAFALLFLTFFLWGSVYVGGGLLSQVPPQLVACLRCCVAVVPLWLMSRPYRKIRISRRDRKYFVAVGGLGYFLTIFLIQMGISLTGSSTAALINALTPVAVTIFAALLLKEKITPVKVVCLILALLGTVVITAGASGQGELTGMLLVLLSVLAWGLASVFMRRLTAKYPPVLVTTYGMLVSLLFHIPNGILSVIAKGSTGLDLRGVLVLLYLGIFGSAVAQYTWTSCLSVLPASTCSLFYPLQPMFSALLGVFLLEERFKPSFFVGLLLISLDIVLSTLETKRLQRGES